MPTRALQIPSTMLFDVVEDHSELGLAVVAAFAGMLLDAAPEQPTGAADGGPEPPPIPGPAPLPVELEHAGLGAVSARKRAVRVRRVLRR